MVDSVVVGESLQLVDTATNPRERAISRLLSTTAVSSTDPDDQQTTSADKKQR
jgi:hypothetical protein